MNEPASDQSEHVLLERRDGILRITFNRPEALNACTTAMLRAVEAALVEAETDDEVRVAVLAGAGRGFCSGADVAADAESPAGVDTLDAGNAVVTAIRRFPKPVVAVATGPVAGIGVSLALASDLVVTADDAFFLLAFAGIGLMPDGGGTALVAASIGRARAMRMALLAERVPAAQAYEWGLVSHLVPAADVAAEADALATTLASGPTAAYRRTKDAINDATLTELDEAFRRERVGQAALMHSDDFGEGMAAFAERRPPRFVGR